MLSLVGVAAALFFSERISEAGGVLALATAAAASSGMLRRGHDQAEIASAQQDVAEGQADVATAVTEITEASELGATAQQTAAAEIASLDRQARARLADKLLGDDAGGRS